MAQCVRGNGQGTIKCPQCNGSGRKSDWFSSSEDEIGRIPQSGEGGRTRSRVPAARTAGPPGRPAGVTAGACWCGIYRTNVLNPPLQCPDMFRAGRLKGRSDHA